MFYRMRSENINHIFRAAEQEGRVVSIMCVRLYSSKPFLASDAHSASVLGTI
jgi:hypothetical protein